MIKTALSSGGVKIDGLIAAGAIGAGITVPDSILQTYGASLMVVGGLILLVIRISIAAIEFYKSYRHRNE